MLVEPVRVRARRDRRLAGIAMVALALAVVAIGAGIGNGLGARTAIPSPDQATAAAQASAPAAQGAPSHLPPIAAARTVELEATMLGNGHVGSSARLALRGWIPAQFDWAAVEVFDGERRLGSPAMRVGSDGTFSGTVDLSPWGTTIDRVLVRLSGLNEVQLFAVPLVSLVVGASTVPQAGEFRQVREVRAAVSR